ncbi:MAG TPA: hypothetical protein DDW65_17305 [Firmicutes bacterium]|jgi:hypothetical protein|nr:hypothetical protein [Bacillota bacterium]
MGKLRLQPREFRLRAGARSEMDRNFLQIVNHLPEETNLSEFIKNAVVEFCRQQSQLSVVDHLQQEFWELQAQMEEFIAKLSSISVADHEKEKISQIKTDLQLLAENITQSLII